KVLDPNAKIDPATRDFPKYRERFKNKGPDYMKRLLAGTIISYAAAIYIVILLMINVLVNNTISWSLIPCLSLVLVWFGVGFPLLKPGQSFYRLFTYDTFATALYLLALNYVISSNFSWAQYASSGLLFVWTIMSGIFIADRIKRRIPIILYYIVSSIIFTAFYALILTNSDIIVHVVLPIYLFTLFFSVLTFLFSKAMVFDIFNFLSILFMNIALTAFAIDMILTRYFQNAFNPTWSLIVLVALVPLSLGGLLMRNLRVLRTHIAKKFHR
ncbi:MAG: hypothetical protein WCT23_07250, partial [Candidatus Neomarinimicrobiota bacterium]